MTLVCSPHMARCPGAANLCCLFFHDDPSPPETLGILAFDAAKTMCRLVSLYNSLTDTEILRLRRHIIRSKSISHLNSKDECFLLSLACAERLEDLNLAAATVERLSRRSSGKQLPRFDAGKLEFGTRDVERKIESMEKLVATTRSLHKAMESLTEMEASERKMQKWRTIRANNGLKVKVECFNDRIMFYRRQVIYFKQVSLWNQTIDKVVGLMGRIINIVYNRICSVFGTSITGIVHVKNNNHKNNKNNNNNNNNNVVKGPNFEKCCCRIEHRELYRVNLCLFEQNEESTVAKKRVKKGAAATSIFPFHHAPSQDEGEVARNNRVLRLAPETTVGGAGLSLRYANVIMWVERYMHAPETAIGNDARVALYEMLPGRLEEKLKAKLKMEWLAWEKLEGGKEGKSATAMQRREEAEEVMELLVPVAFDMVRWQAERNLEKQKFEMKPTVLLLQTLHYSNLEKVEEAMVEVLVGLSYMYWSRKL